MNKAYVIGVYNEFYKGHLSFLGLFTGLYKVSGETFVACDSNSINNVKMYKHKKNAENMAEKLKHNNESLYSYKVLELGVDVFCE